MTLTLALQIATANGPMTVAEVKDPQLLRQAARDVLERERVRRTTLEEILGPLAANNHGVTPIRKAEL